MKRIALVLTALAATLTTSAQIQLGEKGGNLAIGLESNNILYVDDAKLGEAKNIFGSNDYLKIDYTLGRFSVGVQGEAYLPALQGYDDLRNNGYDKPKVMLASKYIQWQDKYYSVMVGDIYDQFGNGLIFRSFEDRQLGINNSIEGFRATGSISDYATATAFIGRPRLYSSSNNYSAGWIGSQYARSMVSGTDLILSLSDMWDSDELVLTVEGSYVNRYEPTDRKVDGLYYDNPLTGETDYYIESLFGMTSPDLDLFSLRLNMDYMGFTLRSEFAGKSDDVNLSAVESTASDGMAFLAELGYNIGGLSISAQARRLERMGTLLSYYGDNRLMGNTLN